MTWVAQLTDSSLSCLLGVCAEKGLKGALPCTTTLRVELSRRSVGRGSPESDPGSKGRISLTFRENLRGVSFD